MDNQNDSHEDWSRQRKRTTFQPSPANKPSFEMAASTPEPRASIVERTDSMDDDEAEYHHYNPDFTFLTPDNADSRSINSDENLVPTTTTTTTTTKPQTIYNPAFSQNTRRITTSGISAYNTPAISSPLQQVSYDTSMDHTTLANNTTQSLEKFAVDDQHVSEKPVSHGARKKRCLWVSLAILILLIVLAAVLIPVGLLVIKPKTSDNDQQKAGNTNDTNGNANKIFVPDSAKGTILDPNTWQDHTDFNLTYTGQKVGGLSVMGLNSTWDDSKRPNEHVPPLKEPFQYGKMPIRGVNLGGWLILEPFITPSFFPDQNGTIVDEWTYIDELNKTKGMDEVQKSMEKHYSTFVTEDTFKEISEAGLDHVRIPFGYWAVKANDGDHFLPQVCWRYLLRGIEWARKYGLRVNVDLHSVPGGQNGWNHSGRQGVVDWLNGSKGGVYGDQALDIHKQLSAFFAQDRYKNIVTIYGLVNEPKMQTLQPDKVISWTKEAYKIVRDNDYNGNIVFGDGFLGAERWKGVFSNNTYPNMTLDLHNYVIFNPDLIKMSHTAKLNFVCSSWAGMMNSSINTETGHGPTMVGEWSQADNDCTKYVNNVGLGPRWLGEFDTGGDDAVTTPSCPQGANCTCSESNKDPRDYTDEYKQFLLQFAELQMEVFEQNGAWGSMYWTWDTEDWESAQWSYRKGREAGILPKVAYERKYSCADTIPDYAALGLSEAY